MPTPQEIATICEFAEAEAMADVYQSLSPEVAQHFGARIERTGSAVVFIVQQIPEIMFNRVVGLGVKEPATEAMLDDILARFEKAGVKKFAFQLSPAVQPADEMPLWLEARDIIRDDNWSKFYREAQMPPDISTDLRIERVGMEHQEAFLQTLAVGYGLPDFMQVWFTNLMERPGWHHYMAFDGDLPVATGVLYVKGNIGYLSFGGTLPSHRRRGAQGAIMSRRIRDAIALGCQHIVTDAQAETDDYSNPSVHNMQRTGFQLAYQRPNYIPRAALDMPYTLNR